MCARLLPMPQAAPQVLKHLSAAWITRHAARKRFATGGVSLAGRFLMMFKAFGGKQLVAVLTFLKLWLRNAIVKLWRILRVVFMGVQQGRKSLWFADRIRRGGKAL